MNDAKEGSEGTFCRAYDFLPLGNAGRRLFIR